MKLSVFWTYAVAISLAISASTLLHAQTNSTSTTSIAPKEPGKVVNIAKGTFEVKLAPQPLSDVAAGENLGRMSIDKVFAGDLVGTSKGEMLSAMTEVKGSAGYVALERVTGTIQGKRGSFVLQHSGTMNRSAPTLTVSVVPDSGTEGLVGISGTFKILIEPGKHSYEFSYSLPNN
jgi:hypothetical protein